MKSATKEVCDSGLSDNEPLAVKKSSLHQTEAKKYADYLLPRNESFKRKAENQAVEQLKAEKKQLEERLLAEKKRRHSLEFEHKRDVECDREEWMHFLSVTELNQKLTNVGDGSDVRKVRVVKFSQISCFFYTT